MKVGDRVTIYEDPYTEKKAEGKATLIEYVKTDCSHIEGIMELWYVHFPSDDLGQDVQRWIKSKS